MNNNPQITIPHILKSLHPISQLENPYHDSMLGKAVQEKASSGHIIHAQPDREWLSYLIEGELQIQNGNDVLETIEAGTPRSRMPIFRLHSDSISATSQTNSQILRINRKSFEALLEDTIDLVSSIEGIDLAVAVTPPESIDYFKSKTPEGTLLLPVICADIGDCLKQVFEELFERGYPKVMAFNSDGPSLPIEYIHQAFALLETRDVVFGPSDDGGYYLVGMRRPHPELFKDIPWSTAAVLDMTLARAVKLGIKTKLLQAWNDLDTFEDLRDFYVRYRIFQSQRLKLESCKGRFFNDKI